MTKPVFGIIGWKNSGKTTLTERLVRNLTDRGLNVATVKHAHHSFDIDREGTDSFRHRQAGAVETAIVSANRWALMHELREEQEPELSDIIHRMSLSDIIIVEGFKNGSHPKLECRRQSARDTAPLADRIPNIVAVACEEPAQEASPPQFALNDIDTIATFILDFLALGPASSR